MPVSGEALLAVHFDSAKCQSCDGTAKVFFCSRSSSTTSSTNTIARAVFCFACLLSCRPCRVIYGNRERGKKCADKQSRSDGSDVRVKESDWKFLRKGGRVWTCSVQGNYWDEGANQASGSVPTTQRSIWRLCTKEAVGI